MKTSFRRLIEDSVTLSHAIYTDSNLYDYLDRRYSDPYEYYYYYEKYMRNKMTRYIHVYSHIQEVNIYTDNPDIANSAGYLQIDRETRECDWYKKLNTAQNQILVYPHFEKKYDGIHRIFSIIRKLDKFHDKNTFQKVLKIDLQFKSISQIIADEQLNGHIFLVNNANQIVYATDRNYMNDEEQQFLSFDQVKVGKTDIIMQDTFDNVSSLNNWKIIGIFSEKKIANLLQEPGFFVVAMAFISLSAATLAILLIARSFNSRILLLSQHMEKVKKQSFEPIEYNGGKDEIGQLIEDFNRMILRIRELIQNVYEADLQKKSLELERKQAELNALQSQIDPHFLFNTLETIRMRSLIKNETETAEIIKYLSRTFRRTLSWKQDMITVMEEVEFLENFLKIQQYRFKDKITYELNIEEEAKRCRIPKMSIQPFVENASIHGIEKIKGAGVIKVDIRKEDNRLHCVIEDNGIGIPRERLAKIYEDMESESSISENIGIANVYRRLKLFYGDRFELRIESKENEGTRVILSLPLTF